MTENLYRNLQEHFDTLPIGFPAAPSGADIDVLKIMYEPEEAETALCLTPVPVTAETLADKMKIGTQELSDRLERMAKRGLIMRIKLEGVPYYALVPYIVGTYEFQLNRITKEYNRAHNRIMAETMGLEVFSGKTSQFRIIPVERSLEGNQAVLPHEKIREYLKKARRIAAVDCLCRLKAEKMGKGCGHPLRVCLSLNEFADYYLEADMPAEEVSSARALEILDECERLGLVAHTQNAGDDVYYICNCCKCGCGIMGAVNMFGLHKQISSSTYIAITDESLCSGCQTCVDRCIFGARSIEDNISKVKKSKCLGCGLCKTTCPSGAISMEKRQAERLPDMPADVQEMYDRIQEERNKPVRILSLNTIKKTIKKDS